MALIKKDVPVSFDRDLSRMRTRLQRFFEEPFGFDLPLPMIGEKPMDRVVWSPATVIRDLVAAGIPADLPGVTPRGPVGNIGLSATEESRLVAFMRALSDR